ncbi:MAG: hypothetical protein WCH37_11815, partial [Synechococcaceae cyanobacterium ELA182]
LRRQFADQVGAVGVAMPGGIEDQLFSFCLVLLPQILPMTPPSHVQAQVLYSARHGYAHRAHLICELPPKVAAAAMGHSVETHLAAYSKWCGDDVVDDAFERAATRLGR